MVPPDKQKIVFKGKTLKDENAYATHGQPKFKPGCLIGLIGKAEGTGKDLDNIQRKVFVEDLSKEERAKYLKENYNVSICHFSKKIVDDFWKITKILNFVVSFCGKNQFFFFFDLIGQQ